MDAMISLQCWDGGDSDGGGDSGGGGGDLELRPVLQVVEVKPIQREVPDRRLRWHGDGQAPLLATQLNGLAKAYGRLRKGSVVQLMEYIVSTIQSRSVKLLATRNWLHKTFQIPCPRRSLSSNNSGCPSPQSTNGASSSVLSGRNNQNSMVNGENAPTFNPTAQPSYKPPTSSYKNHGAIMKNEAPPRIIPISALNPTKGCWAIKARDGKVFSSSIFFDSDGGEIRKATCFNAVVDRFYDVVEVGKVYTISKGSLKPAQKNFNHLNNQWEIFLDVTSIVELCPDEDSSIPTQQFNFRLISDVENVETNSIVDIIALWCLVNPFVTILRKNGMETQRENFEFEGMFPGSKEGRELQELHDSGVFPVLTVKAGKVNDFSGKSVGTISATQLFINPNIHEAQNLRGWFDEGGKNVASLSISNDAMPGIPRNEIRKTVVQIKDEGLGRGDKPDWVTVKATISFIKTDNFCYTACPLMIGDRKCSKKVVKTGNEKWCCDRCNREIEECDYRYLLQAQVQRS
ncbi:hypothetical protein J5N97_005970 [Dioscorea zingiberensis]|uniref:Replication protein A subunit n=1 Tax=Dioscorea zingiberensis TaxID=325984 RepID=A0A9D5DA23_9LILI|nr:hypothetical protein J5N97_005970 [Dioscorea zingiberensis]